MIGRIRESCFIHLKKETRDCIDLVIVSYYLNNKGIQFDVFKNYEVSIAYFL